MASQDAWSGWIVFAAILILIVGGMDILQGFFGILEDEYVVATTEGLAIVDVTAWGWVTLLWGGLLVVAGCGLLGGRLGTLARHRRRGRQRNPAGRLPGELPPGVPALEHADRRVEHHRALRADGALAGLQVIRRWTRRLDRRRGASPSIRVRVGPDRRGHAAPSSSSSSATSIATSSASTIAPVAEATRAVPTIGAIAAGPADLLGVDADLAGHSEVQQVRDRRGIDGDERRDANEHECLPVETRRGHRVRGHRCKQVETGVSLVEPAMVLLSSTARSRDGWVSAVADVITPLSGRVARRSSCRWHERAEPSRREGRVAWCPSRQTCPRVPGLSDDPLMFTAFGWEHLAASSLVIGAVVVLRFRISLP